ncbi:MAG: DUF4399 domain-containing protein [Burkholderiaceae bacterium]
MKRLQQLSIGIVFSLFAAYTHAQSVDFIEPRDGDTLPTTFTLKFKVEGMPLAPSSDKRQGVGHFHVLIDARDIEPGYVIPNDNQHKHFDKGQTESLMFLQPGKYKLTLQFGDSAHRSYGEKLRKTINITVAGEK